VPARFAQQVEQVQQRPLVRLPRLGGPVGVLDHHRRLSCQAGGGKLGDGLAPQRGSGDQARAAALAPHFGEMGLARGGRPDDHQRRAGQSGHRSIHATAAALDWLTTKSSATERRAMAERQGKLLVHPAPRPR
jgi:hypothetical protein